MSHDIRAMKNIVRNYRDHLIAERVVVGNLHRDLRKAMDVAEVHRRQRSVLDTLEDLSNKLQRAIEDLSEDINDPEIEDWM